MTRKLIALGSLLTLVFVTAATASASGAELKVGEYPATLREAGSIEGGAQEFAGLGTGAIACQHVGFEGALSEGASSVGLNFDFEGCTAGSVKPVTITDSGCTFTATSSALNLACSGAGVVIEVFGSVAAHMGGTPVCEYVLKPQTLEGISFANGGLEYGTLNVNSKAAVTRVSGTSENCGAESQTLTYRGAFLVTAFAEGKHVGVGLEGGFVAGEYPATLMGDSAFAGERQQIRFVTPTRTVSCLGYVDGLEALVEGSESLNLVPHSESTCLAFGIYTEATVLGNECWLDLAIGAGSGHEWSGEGQLKCPEGVSGVEMFLFTSHEKHIALEPACRYRIEPQKLENVSFYVFTPKYLQVSFDSPITIKRTMGSLTLCGAASQSAEYSSYSLLEALSKSGEPQTLTIE